jgi:hypothetical protein
LLLLVVRQPRPAGRLGSPCAREAMLDGVTFPAIAKGVSFSMSSTGVVDAKGCGTTGYLTTDKTLIDEFKERLT